MTDMSFPFISIKINHYVHYVQSQVYSCIQSSVGIPYGEHRHTSSKCMAKFRTYLSLFLCDILLPI